MKFGMRKPNFKKSIKARTTGKIKRKIKKSINPLYGKKGIGFVKNPKKAIKNKIYHKTTFSIFDVFKINKKSSVTRTSSKDKHLNNNYNKNSDVEVKKNITDLKNIVLWGLAILFLLWGLAFWNSETMLFAIVNILLAIVICPFSSNKLKRYQVYAKSKKYIVIVGIILWVVTSRQVLELDDSVNNSIDFENKASYIDAEIERDEEIINEENIDEVKNITNIKESIETSKDNEILHEEKQSVKEKYVENPKMLSQFTKLGYSEEVSQEFVNILSELGVKSLNKVEERSYDDDHPKNEKIPKKDEFDTLYYCDGNIDHDVCGFLVFVKQNSIICVSHYSTFDDNSKYKGSEIYYTNRDGVIGKIIGSGKIVLDIASNSNN